MKENSKSLNVTISTGTLLKILIIGTLVFALIKLINIVLIVLTAIVIASFIESAVNKLKRYIKNRTLSVFLIYIVTISIFVWLFSVFIPVFIQEMSLLVSALGQYIPDNSILNTFQANTISGAKGVVTTISHNASLVDVIKSTQNLVSTLSGGFFDIFGQAFGGALNLILIMIISFYLSIKEKGIENFLRIITPNDSENYIIGLWQRTERKIGLWIQGQVLLGLIIGVLTYLGLTLLGVQYSFVLALITAVFELIPFGIFISVIPAVLFSYLGGGVSLSLMTFGLYFILHQFENYLIYPLIIKKVIGIPPLVVILSILIGADLAGLWGVILAIPMAVLLLEFYNDVEKKKALTRLQ
ncbi:MAG: AI-2E family transporter [Patescibacteria group bacterium]|nr:AI-2E family transporter [Patescibacteria group bacterium]